MAPRLAGVGLMSVVVAQPRKPAPKRKKRSPRAGETAAGVGNEDATEGETSDGGAQPSGCCCWKR